MAQSGDERSLGELFGDLARDTSALVRQELRQAGAEMTDRVRGVGKDAGALVAGAVLLHAALLTIIAAAILALGQLGVTWWLAALIVAVVLAAVGYAALARARSAIKRADLMPRHALKNLKEDQQWVKEQVG